jgi:hypothetical protein
MAAPIPASHLKVGKSYTIPGDATSGVCRLVRLTAFGAACVGGLRMWG